MMPDRIVCFKWTPHQGYRSTFNGDAVNVLRAMLARHYSHTHTLVCFTDDATGIDSRVDVRPLWSDLSNIPSPHGGKNPSCYRRLRLYAADAAEIVCSQRFVMMDLDTVITGSLDALFDCPEEFRIYGDTNPRTHYNGSLVLMTAGSRRQVWEQFNPHTSPHLAKRSGQFGSDQGWIGYCLGGNERKFTKADGVYSMRNDIKPPYGDGRLPANARLVVFHGNVDPWMPGVAARWPWIGQHYHAQEVVAA